MIEYDVDGIIGNIDFEKNKFCDVGNRILLTNHEIEVLNQYDIPYRDCHNLKEIIFQIEAILDEMDIVDEELDYVSSMIAERDYYQNTNQ